MSLTDHTGLRRYKPPRPISDARRAELADAGLLVPGSTFSRKGQRRLPEKPTSRHPVPTGPDQATVELVLKRSLRWVDGLGLVACCEVCGDPLTGQRAWQWSVHHCKPRDGSRTDNTPANLLVCHGVSNVDGCHGRIHQEPTWARALGLLVSRHDTRPADTIGRCIWGQSRWTTFTAGGRYADDVEEGSPLW